MKTTDQKTILVTDDDSSILSIFEFVLNQAGYKVIKASSGKECLSVLKSGQKIDLVFLDIKMPHMNGVETFKRIQDISPTVLVIMMTGYAMDQLLKEAYELGAYGIVYKPFDVEEFLSILDAVFNLPSHIL